MTNYLETVDSEWFKQRLTGAMVVICVAFAVLIVRLIYLQIIEGTEYRRLSEINSIRLQSVDAPRGLIFDRNGELLVDNRPSFDLSIIPKDAKPVQETLARLAHHLELPVEDLEAVLEQKKGRAAYKPVQLRSDIGRDALAAVEGHNYELPGIEVNVTPRRHYIHEQSAAHLLGYLGEINAEELKKVKNEDLKGGDFIGKFGVEKSFEAYLRGKRGGRQVEVNATGQVVKVLNTVDAKAGRNLFLTIDYHLQRTAEELLAGKAGAVVAVDPRTGEVLAMASSPAFDQNLFITGLSREVWNKLINNPHRPMENKAVQATYPPASTYKIITAMAGLEEGIIDESTTFDCPGYLAFGNRVFRCWRHIGHGSINVVRALSESCDVFFYHVGLELGPDRLAWYARAAGLGAPTGIELPNEEGGLIPTAEWKYRRFGVPWQRGESLSVAIGQGYNLVTPLQMAMVVAAVGNGGIRIKPTIVKAIRDVDGMQVYRHKPEKIGQLPVSAATLALVRQGLWQVVNRRKGTAYRERIEGIEMCGKTGTAQVVGRKSTEDMSEEEIAEQFRPHAWFVGYAPAEDPKIAVAVMVEHGEHGSSTAAPIARDVITAYLGEAVSLKPPMSAAADKNPNPSVTGLSVKQSQTLQPPPDTHRKAVDR